MTLYPWLGVPAAVLLISVIVFAFRQGLKVKPDPNNRNFGPSNNEGP